MKTRALLCIPFLLLAACSDSGSSSSGQASTPKSNSAAIPQSTPTRKSLFDRVNEDNGYKQDSQGNWAPKHDKRSTFESKKDSYFKGDYATKDFKTGSVEKKSWWGDTKYATKKFDGNTDGSRFETASKFQSQGARESNTAAKLHDNYKTSNYGTSAATESSGKLLDKPTDAQTDFRRKVYGAPSVIDWREQRAMSVNETKGILGR